jgi:hypothetical protein
VLTQATAVVEQYSDNNGLSLSLYFVIVFS